ncbi:hypothetical protein ACQY0O_004711 [Thecaphora frezii]
MAALQRPFSIGAEVDLLPANPRQDFTDFSFDFCRKYAKLPSSSSRQPSSGGSSSPRRHSVARQPEVGCSSWRAGTSSRMFASSLTQYDGGVAQTSATAVAADPNGENEGTSHWISSAYQTDSGFVESYEIPKPPSPPPAPPLPALSGSEGRDAFNFTATLSNGLATDEAASKRSTPIWEWCANMVCYIWFAGAAPESGPGPTATTGPCRSPTTTFNAPLQSSPLASRRHRKADSLGHLSECSKFSVHDLSQAVDAHLRASADPIQTSSSADADSSRDPLSLRLSARRRFKLFVKDLLNTTQVSNSVILLALLYIHRLKSRHPGLRGEEGSEFRLFITALMLGNKFLDDHTYTNKTWAELSGIELKDITRMEVEFWLGLSMSIYVSDVDFRHWIRTLEQLAQRRQQALIRREHEAARMAAIKHHQSLYYHHHHQQQQLHHHQIQRHQGTHGQQHVQRSRASPSHLWSPSGSYHSDGAGSPCRASTSLSGPGSVSPLAQTVEVAFARSVTAFPPSLSESDAHQTLPSRALAMPINNIDSRHLSPEADTLMDNRRASSVGYRDIVAQNGKRLFAAVHSGPCYHAYSSPSPERPRKRLAGLNLGHGGDRPQGTSVSPRDEALRRYQLRDAPAQPGRDGVSPISAQHYPRSVFEPLVTTPNTLLAPYTSHQNAQIQQHPPLAYWQLAAGHDRGILGVHLPAPPSTSTQYCAAMNGLSHGGDGTSPLRSKRAVIETAPYPRQGATQVTEATSFDGPLATGTQPTHNMSTAGIRQRTEVPHLQAPNGSTPCHYIEDRCNNHPYHLQHQQHQQHQHQHQQYAHPHLRAAPAPFNNAEENYVDPFARYL